MASAQQMLEHPITALVVALVICAIALSGKFSVTATQIALVAAWIVAVYGLRAQPAPLWIGFGLMFGGLLLILAWWARPEAVPENFGRLEPQKTELLFSSADKESRPVLEIGDSGTTFVWGGPAGAPLFTFFNDSLVIERRNGQVLVSTTMRNTNDHLIAELIRNEWKVSPPPNTWDRNYSKDALEVKGPKGNIVLQVRALSDRIQLQGEWWRDEINGVRLVKSNDPAHQGAFMQIFGTKFRPENTANIVPLFKYPSEKHFGEFAK